MKQLLKRLQTIKDQKLTAYKQELQAQEKEELADLQRQVDRLRDKLKKTETTLEKQQAQLQDFQHKTRVRFFENRFQRDKLRQLWNHVAHDYFSSTQQVNDWLKSQLEQALVFYSQQTQEIDSATIKAGKSYELLKKLNSDSQINLVQESGLEAVDGFIMIGPNFEIDARLSSYLEEKFQTYQDQLVQRIFYQNS